MKNKYDLFFFIGVYYLIAPALTIVHFTVLNGTTFIIHGLILFPILISFLFFGIVLLKGVMIKSSIGLGALFLCVTLFIFAINFLISIDDFENALISLLRIFSSIIFLYLGVVFRDNLTIPIKIKYICTCGILGLLGGIFLFFGFKYFGYSMTHSITADGAIGPILYYLFGSNKFFLSFILAVILIFLSGKSANLVSFAMVFVMRYLTVKGLGKFFSLAMVLCVAILLSDFYAVILPDKLLTRIDLFFQIIKSPEDAFATAGSKLTSGRSDEILYLLDKWSNNPLKLIFGDGLSTVVVYGDNEVRSTMHMSYMKVIDMVGLVGLFFLIFGILGAIINALSCLNHKILSFFALCIFAQLILSIFQYSFFQDPLLWISLGVLWNKSFIKNFK